MALRFPLAGLDKNEKLVETHLILSSSGAVHLAMMLLGFAWIGVFSYHRRRVAPSAIA
jgi:hypothetical protein